MPPPYTPVEKVFDLHFIVQVPLVDGGALTGNQYFATSGIRLPEPNALEDILRMGGVWYLLYSFWFTILTVFSTTVLSIPSATISGTDLFSSHYK